MCVALSGDAMAERATSLLAECRFFEFRIDTASDPERALADMECFLTAHAEVVAIATSRRVENGGRITGTAQDEARLLHAAAAAGAAVLDLSLETAEELQHSAPEVLDGLRRGPASLLLSWHDFAGTPDLNAVHARMVRLQPDLLKIVPTANCLDDALRLMDLLQAHREDGNLIAMSMGVPGMLTRVLGLRAGSRFTFAAPDAESATAPGQLDLLTLRHQYRVEAITSATRIYGVFGDPILGSKSPAMLNAAFAAAGVDAVYLPLQTSNAGELFRTCEALQMQGASVTMPLKERILERSGDRLQLAPLAATIGAANTLVRQPNGALAGHNTDAAGITDPLATLLPLQGARVLVLGAGGAARAAVFGLRAQGADVAILNRSEMRAEALAQAAGARVISHEMAATTRFDAIVHATPHGMRGQQVETLIEAEEMQTSIFFDLVFNPLETPLLQAARVRGIKVIAGVEMFLAQGAAQFRLWTGVPAPEDVMRQAVLQALRSL